MTRAAVAAAAVVALVAIVAGGVLVGGVQPGDVLGGASDAGGASNSGGTTDPGGAGTTTDGGAESTTTTTEAERGYDFTIQHVTECGGTCRDVTARLANAGSTTREDVRVTTRVYADGDLLWRGNETVGRLGPRESHTSTKRVKLGLGGAAAIQSNGGYVTIVTVVRSADETVRFEDRRKVG